MNEYTEKRFGYLRELSTDEKTNMIKDLEEENEAINNMIDDRSISSEQRSELYNDLNYNQSRIDYLRTILEEKHL